MVGYAELGDGIDSPRDNEPARHLNDLRVRRQAMRGGFSPGRVSVRFGHFCLHLISIGIRESDSERASVSSRSAAKPRPVRSRRSSPISIPPRIFSQLPASYARIALVEQAGQKSDLLLLYVD